VNDKPYEKNERRKYKNGMTRVLGDQISELTTWLSYQC